MTKQQIESIKASWQFVATLDDTIVGELFYTRLLEVNPELKALFKSPRPEQSRKLVAMIGYIVVKLDKLDDLAEDIQRLAQRHVHYGVQEKHYEVVGAALVWTLKKGLGEYWNTELEEAWINCYTILSAAMIDAGQEAEQSH